MILTSHAIVGASVASLFPNHPVTAFSVAFATHFLLDAIPHSQYDIDSSSLRPGERGKFFFNKSLFFDIFKIGSDGILGLALAFFLFASNGNLFIVLGGAIFGMLPDFLQFIYILFPRQPLLTLQRFHFWIHHNRHLKPNSIFGVFSQMGVVLAIVLLVKYFIPIF
jgi:hypothetical protein